MALSAGVETATLARRSQLGAALAACRPRQWSKNLLLFAGLVFAAKLGDLDRWLEALTAFVAYCAASSAAYLVNDVRDAANDRLHPLKRNRPVARGELSSRSASLLAAALCPAALALTAVLGASSVVILIGVPRAPGRLQPRPQACRARRRGDDRCFFVIRSAAGAAAVDVRISPWLLAVTALLALFLALAKRRSELVLPGSARPVLEGYSLALLDRLLALAVA